MCELHTSARSFKENFLHSHRLVGAMNFSNISNQIFFSWRLRLYQMLSILHCLSIQLKGLGRAQLFHEPTYKPTDFLWLILTLVTILCLPISLLTSVTSLLLVTRTLTSLACAVYLSTIEAPGNVRLRRTRFALNPA